MRPGYSGCLGNSIPGIDAIGLQKRTVTNIVAVKERSVRASLAPQVCREISDTPYRHELQYQFRECNCIPLRSIAGSRVGFYCHRYLAFSGRYRLPIEKRGCDQQQREQSMTGTMTGRQYTNTAKPTNLMKNRVRNSRKFVGRV